ncbi:hypothetical protein AMAG_15864 [Allomyces macrogynus ATCC 38327]|uniref:Receptor ligand binding region domain-containing protein n=1 Tax=Allomyces macrogynus (strain ATCC 38327) TaxID=578462 RepID=A0A0L0T8Y3_ALLM3|nr:hypothetical protein AMAG_15864 [Allomyces macrogynus ATCC 38327]|eukprot:KNE71207.1 hypothetical protein AMAG_15864 [Allomyces macrogynus ATCC 38327]
MSAMITNPQRRRSGHPRPMQATAAVLAVLCLAVTFAAAAQFKIAGVFPKGGGTTVQDSLTVAQDLVNEYASGTGGGNHSFVLDFKDTNGTITGSSKAMFDAINDGAVAVIGDLNSDSTIPMALQSNNFKVWQCTGSVTTPLLGAKNGYPYFFRTIPDDGVQGVFLAQFVRRMGWRSIAVLFSSDAYGNGIQSTFQTEASKQGIAVTTTQTFSPWGGPNADYSIALNAILHSGTRIVLFDTNGTITGSSKAMFDAINDGAVAVIGDLNSDSTIPMALQSNNFKVWQCTGSVTTPLLGAKNGYPYFFRTIPDDGVQGVFLAQFVRRMGWRSIAVLFSSDAYVLALPLFPRAEADS